MGTRYVRMLVSLTHSRYDDRHWRDYPAGSLIEIPDWEADLIVGNIAVEVPPEHWPRPEAPEKSPVVSPYSEPAAAADHHLGKNAATAGSDDDDTPEAGPAEEAEPPRPADPKQAWVDYAIRQGADPDKAQSMTKIDLQSRYGGRL